MTSGGVARWENIRRVGGTFRWSESPAAAGTSGGAAVRAPGLRTAPARLRPCESGRSSSAWWQPPLTALWFLGALYVVLGYRPGGPIDGLVGAAAALPMAIALAAVFWPPVARGDRAFAGIVWLGLGAGLLLVPSIGEVLNQLLARGPQTLLPSLETAYPWLLALIATSLFAGLGIARRLLGETALRRAAPRPRWRDRDRACGRQRDALRRRGDRERPRPARSAGPELALRTDDGDAQPPPCDGALTAGTTATLDLHLSADVDGRPVGAVALAGERSGVDVRWSADVASGICARPLRGGPDRDPGLDRPSRGAAGLAAAPSIADDALVDVQALRTALSPGIRTTAENHGVEFVEGLAPGTAGSPSTARPSCRRAAGSLAGRRRYATPVAGAARLLGVHRRRARTPVGQRQRSGRQPPGRRDPGHDPDRARRDRPRRRPINRAAGRLTVEPDRVTGR